MLARPPAGALLALVLIVAGCALPAECANATTKMSTSGPASGGSILAELWRKIRYDDSYIVNNLDVKFAYLKHPNQSGAYVAPRDYFNFSAAFQPNADYLAKVNIEQLLFHELRAAEFSATRHYGSLDIWSYSSQRQLNQSNWPHTDERKCLAQLEYLAGEIRAAELNSSHLFAPGYRNIQLLRWIDSWGRPTSESQWGKVFWVGSYRGCRRVAVPGPDAPPDAPPDGRTVFELDEAERRGEPPLIKFHFCWAKMAAKDWPERDELVPRASLKLGMCLPKACDTRLALAHRAKLLELMRFNMSPTQRSRLPRLLDVYCLPSKQSLAVSSARDTFLWSTGAWLALITLASLAFAALKPTQDLVARSWWLTAAQLLTIQENLRRLGTEDKPAPGLPIDLRVLGLIKLVGCVAVLMGHCFTEFHLNWHSTSFMLIESRQLVYNLVALFSKALELFMVLSSTIAGYLILSRFGGDSQSNGQPKMRLLLNPLVYVGLNLARYLRLAPVAMFTFAFIKSTMVHLGEGPFWDYGTSLDSQQGVCHQINWSRLLLWPVVFDWRSKGGSHYLIECMPSSWFVITEMKMFLVVPLYMYVLYTRKQWRLRLTLATVIASGLWQYKDMSLQQLVYFSQYLTYSRTAVNMALIKHLDPTYFSPMNRFHCVAIGLLAGLALFRYKQRELICWPKWMRSRWLVPALLAWHTFELAAPILTDLDYRRTGALPNEQLAKVFVVLKQRVDAATYAVLILRLCSDWAPALMQLVSPLLYKASKLSYCVYSVHLIFYAYVMSATEQSRPDTLKLPLFILGFFLVLGSLVIAFPLYLLVESPLALLLSHLADRRQVSSPGSASRGAAQRFVRNGKKLSAKRD